LLPLPPVPDPVVMPELEPGIMMPELAVLIEPAPPEPPALAPPLQRPSKHAWPAGQTTDAQRSTQVPP
jgi:hypothetical protein